MWKVSKTGDDSIFSCRLGAGIDRLFHESCESIPSERPMTESCTKTHPTESTEHVLALKKSSSGAHTLWLYAWTEASLTTISQESIVSVFFYRFQTAAFLTSFATREGHRLSWEFYCIEVELNSI